MLRLQPKGPQPRACVPSNGKKIANTKSGAQKQKDAAAKASTLPDDTDILQRLGSAARQRLEQAPKLPLAQAATVKPAPKKNIDWGSSFIMADLTHTPAHAARLRMLDVLEEVHTKTPGGIFAPGKRPARDESHISVVEIPSAELAVKDRKNERADPAASSAFRRLATEFKPAKLALDEDSFAEFEGPRGPIKEFKVLSLRLQDPSESLSHFRRRFGELGGTAMEKSAEMHLTLAYLKLGANLDETTKRTILNIARQANHAAGPATAGPSGWHQKDFYYSGRYSDKELVRIRLQKDAE